MNMNEEKFYDKLTDWMGINISNDFCHANVTVSKVHSFDEEGYYQRIFLVTEKHYSPRRDDIVDVYVIRMFGFDDNNINLSVDFEEVMSYNDLLTNMGKIIKLILDKMDK